MIKRCPHCGSPSDLNSRYSYKTKRYFVFVRCEMCGAQGKIYNSEQNPEEQQWDNDACHNAIKAWNMRNGILDENC